MGLTPLTSHTFGRRGRPGHLELSGSGAADGKQPLPSHQQLLTSLINDFSTIPLTLQAALPPQLINDISTIPLTPQAALPPQPDAHESAIGTNYVNQIHANYICETVCNILRASLCARLPTATQFVTPSLMALKHAS